MNHHEKIYRFLWRAANNAVCSLACCRAWLFPPVNLAAHFGRGDAEYAWKVFLSHYRQLHEHGFSSARRVLEVGPGRNIGTSLLWWCYLASQKDQTVEIVCWDVFKNVNPETSEFWSTLARDLLGQGLIDKEREYEEIRPWLHLLESVGHGTKKPAIRYWVMPMDVMARQAGEFDLIYSQAAIEHVWFVQRLWEVLCGVTAPAGYHSHRIDLADHGRRDSNYIEMLQWSAWAYWLTQRFVPGAINRWRASDHLRMLERCDIRVLYQRRELRDSLPFALNRLARKFRDYDDTELRCTGLDLVARKQSY